jgi:nitrilase
MSTPDGTGSKPRDISAAAVQAEPEWLDLAGSVKKACRLIEEAARNGAKIIGFPELWIAGYPAWIWNRLVDFPLTVEYIKNSLSVESEEMKTLCECARENEIVVVLGFSERDGASVYISQCTIGANGKLLMKRRKLKPSHMERTVFGGRIR